MVILKWEEIKDDKETLSFKTYKNYLESLASLILTTYGIEEKKILSNLHKTLHSSKIKITKKREMDFEKIKSLLINSWHTELNFLLPNKAIKELIRYSIHWAPVQMYYSIYLAIRALFEASNQSVNNTHEPTLRSISNWIVEREIFPYPWSCYCNGISDLGNFKFYRFNKEIKEIEVRKLVQISFPKEENYELFLAKFLKTTRDNQFNLKKFRVGKIKTKRGKTPKRFFKYQKNIIEKEMHKTTLFDCLYRLRIKSNYEEAEDYILSEMSDSDAENFYKSLKVILSASLFVLEFLIKEYIGEEKFRGILESLEKAKRTKLFDEESIFLRKNFLL